MAAFEPNRPIDQAVLWKAQTTNPLHSHLPFFNSRRCTPRPAPPSLLLRAGDVEVNPGPVCRECTKTIRRDITPITCSSCSQPYHRTCSDLTRKKKYRGFICRPCTELAAAPATMTTLTQVMKTTRRCCVCSTKMKTNIVIRCHNCGSISHTKCVSLPP